MYSVFKLIKLPLLCYRCYPLLHSLAIFSIYGSNNVIRLILPLIYCLNKKLLKKRKNTLFPPEQQFFSRSLLFSKADAYDSIKPHFFFFGSNQSSSSSSSLYFRQGQSSHIRFQHKRLVDPTIRPGFSGYSRTDLQVPLEHISSPIDTMTRVTRDFRDSLHKDVVPAVSADVKFASSRFPSYRIGANDQIFDVKDDPKVLSMKEVVARETAQLLDQQKRMSVRDLANKFEKGLAAAAKLSEEAKLKEATSLEKHVLLKKLRDALESLRGRVAGRNKDDVEEAIAMVEALAVQLTQREGELFIEKAEVKKLATFLKQASEDAKKLVEEERAFARAEIESARAAVQRVEEALLEHEQMSRASGKQDMEDLMKEVQEARRIKMLHQPSKVMDMEYELRALRNQLAEKSKHFLQLQKKLAMCKTSEENISRIYEIDGTEALGSCLRVRPCSDDGPDLSNCMMQWYRSSSDGSKKELISGATKSVYAPEPFDVGRALHADIIYDGHLLSLSTVGKIDPAAGLGSYVEALVRKHDVDFNVVVTQMSGEDHTSESIHLFHVGKMRIKLCKGKTVIAKEYYSSAMQLCGVRGGGNAAAQALYWQAKKGVSFVVAFESERERNAAIMLARRFACDCNVTLAGPEDRTETALN